MKAILVIDTPNKCWECPLHRSSWDEDNEEIMICRGTYMESHYGEIPSYCPLKPLPYNDFIHEAEGYQTEEEYKAYVSGWNDCLDALLGENENG